jgi:hypothetical protein
MNKRKWLVLGGLAIVVVCIAEVNWLRTYEPIAIWLEGIALVLIFVWDRLDSRKQHEDTVAQLKVSQKQVEASLEQVEASHKPFVAFSTEPRNAEEAVLEMGGAVGGLIVRCPGGIAEIGNVGSGPAINVHYRGTHNVAGATEEGPSGYLAGIIPGEKFLTPIPRGILQGQKWEIVFTYASLSGRKYQTKCTLDDLVLTNVGFERVN